MVDSDPLLRLINIKKYFPVRKGLVFQKDIGQVKAVERVSLDLYKGETLGVIGESGCGKSTLARVIVGLIDATSGEARYRNRVISTKMPNSMRKMIQLVFQDPYSSLNPRMRTRRIIEEPLRIHSKLTTKEKHEKTELIMESMGLSKDDLNKYPHEFSGGQRQRIGIARALILDPEILIFDEPMSALDISIQAQILNLLKSTQKEKKLTYVFISHDMSVIRYISDHVAVMYLGHIVELAPKKMLFEDTMHPYSISLKNAIPVADPNAIKQRILLKGDIPIVVETPHGCPFQSRCSLVRSICLKEKPELIARRNNHFVACHLCN